MKKHLYPLLLVFTLLSTIATANNSAGGEITSEWLSDSTYRFYLKYYRICNNIAEPSTMSLCFNNPCNANSFSVVMNKFTAPTNSLPVCPTKKNSCDSPASNIPGLRTVIYAATVTLPARCNQWRAFISIQNRVATINLANSTTTPMYLEYVFNNTGSYQGNSSPYFVGNPFPTVRENLNNTYNNVAIDVNGDSLVSQVINPLKATMGCTSLPTNAAFSSIGLYIPYRPFPMYGSFQINESSGSMSFYPSTTGFSSLAVRVNEYRSGVLIGSVIRETLINTQPQITGPGIFIYNNCNTASPPVNGVSTIYGCIDEPLSFCFDIKNSDTSKIYYIKDDHLTKTPGAVITYSNIGSDSVRATFMWTPTKNDLGHRNLIFTVIDSTCHQFYSSYRTNYSMSMYVFEATVPIIDTVICPGDSLTLSVNSDYVSENNWSVISGNSSISCTNCHIMTAKPTMNTTFQVATRFNSSIGNTCYNKVTVDVLPKALPTVASTDTIICIGNAAQLSATGTGNLNWRVLNGTAGSLSCVQCTNPIATPFINTTYVVETGAPVCIILRDTVTVNVNNTQPYTPSVSITSDFYGTAIRNYPVKFEANVEDCDMPAYQWMLNGNDVAGETNKVWNAMLTTPNAYVACRISCADQCAINKTQNSNTIHLQVANSVENINHANGISIYPNPSSDGIFTISANKQVSNTDLIVINSLGQTVYAEKGVTILAGSRMLNLQQHPAGVYTIKLGDVPYRIIISK